MLHMLKYLVSIEGTPSKISDTLTLDLVQDLHPVELMDTFPSQGAFNYGLAATCDLCKCWS